MSSNVGIIVAGVIGVISISALIMYATNKSLKNDTTVDNKEDTNRYSLSSLDDEKNEDRETIYDNPYLGSTEYNPKNFNFNSESDDDSVDEQKGGNNKSKKNKSKKNKSKKNKSKKNKSKKNKSNKNKSKKTNK
jgi:FtsZ-interacting cell division protein ZipA